MLEKTISNSYTWWCVNQNRTKQSKWLENDLQGTCLLLFLLISGELFIYLFTYLLIDHLLRRAFNVGFYNVDMEERIKNMLTIIEVDADTFKKKAEMYYKRRPELIDFVQDCYKSYRSLAERYDHLSNELLKANNTIASICPEQVHIEIEDDDVDGDRIGSSLSKNEPDYRPEINPFHQLEKAIFRKPGTSLAEEDAAEETISSSVYLSAARIDISQMSADEMKEEIKRLQNGIVILQTEKDFIKNSYEKGLVKYLDVERRINEMEARLTALQDALKINHAPTRIADGDAQALMIAMTLGSCEKNLVSLYDEQKKSREDCRKEQERVRCLVTDFDSDVPDYRHWTFSGEGDDEVKILMEKKRLISEMELNLNLQKLPEFAESINELCNKVSSIETTMISHRSKMRRLVQEYENFHSSLIENSGAGRRNDETARIIKEELRVIMELDRSVGEESIRIEKEWTEAYKTFNDITSRLTQHNSGSPAQSSPMSLERLSERNDEEEEEEEEKVDSITTSWHELFLDGLEEKEKILLAEYTSVLKNYKETRRRLTESEKKNQDHLFESVSQMRDLRNAFVLKDEEVRSLRRKLSVLEPNGNHLTDVDAAGDEIPDVNDLMNHIKSLPRHPPPLPTDEENYDEHPAELQYRREIDNLLHDNLDFWLRFSSSFQQIHTYKLLVEKLQESIADLKEESIKSESTPSSSSTAVPTSIEAYKSIKNLQTDLSVWIEQYAHLKVELQGRSSSLKNMSGKISKFAGKDELRSHQAYKFQGEILNMQQENNKVENELQVGLDHVKRLQSELENAFAEMKRIQKLSDMAKNQHHHRKQEQQGPFQKFPTRQRVPLGTFLFGHNNKPNKPKKKSLFSFVNQALKKN